MNESHEPDPRFIESLQWQLGRELRRRNRMGGGPRRVVRVLKLGGLMLGCSALGAVAMGFRQQLSESWRKELLETRLEVQVELANRRVAMQLEALGLTREQVEQGVRSERDLAYFELQIAEAEAEATIKELELEEVQRSGKEPDDALSAPLVDGRDFVSERTEARREVARRHLEVVRSDVELSRQRAEAGLVSEDEVLARHLIARQAELRLESLDRQLELRRAYLDKEITAVEVELRMLEAEAQNRLALLDRQRAHFQRELERYQAAVDDGSMHPASVAQLRAQVAETEAQLRLAQTELEIVQRELEERASRR
jgi:hypothetical protein